MDHIFPFHDEENEYVIEDKIEKIEKQFVNLFKSRVYEYGGRRQLLCQFFDRLTKVSLSCECRPFEGSSRNLIDIDARFIGKGSSNKSFFVSVDILALKYPRHLYVYGMLFYNKKTEKLETCFSHDVMEYVYEYLLKDKRYDAICKNLPKELVIELFKY